MPGTCGTPSLRSSALGLGSGAGCCVAECPKEPLSNVVICVQVNRNTLVTFQRGCYQGVDAAGNCLITWSPLVVSETSWGKASRVATYNQTVPQDSFVRVSLCAAPGSCSASACGIQYDAVGVPVTNKLLNYTVDLFDIVGYLDSVIGTSSADTVQDGCVIISNDTPCQDEPLDLLDLQWGTSIIVGPIGSRAWSLFPVLEASTPYDVNVTGATGAIGCTGACAGETGHGDATFQSAPTSDPAVVGIPVVYSWEYAVPASTGLLPADPVWIPITSTTLPAQSAGPTGSTYTGAGATGSSIVLTNLYYLPAGSVNGVRVAVRAKFENPAYFSAPGYSEPAYFSTLG
jgi:hypothetical protein